MKPTEPAVEREARADGRERRAGMGAVDYSETTRRERPASGGYAERARRVYKESSKRCARLGMEL